MQENGKGEGRKQTFREIISMCYGVKMTYMSSRESCVRNATQCVNGKGPRTYGCRSLVPSWDVALEKDYCHSHGTLS